MLLLGEWNKNLELAFTDGRVQNFPVGSKSWTSRRRIRSIMQQHPRESRRVWQEVTAALRKGDLELAANQKAELEETQRIQMEKMCANGTQHSSKHFQPIGEGGWIWNQFPGIFDE